jgi:hypothetical protein
MITSCILSKEKIKLESTNKKMDIIGEAYNTDNKPVVAVAYGVASRGPYTLPDNAEYMKPEMVAKLAEAVLPPALGPLEPVDEVKKNFL